MKNGIQILLFISFIIGFAGCKKQSGNIVYDKKYLDEIKAARKDMMFYLSGNHVPGATVAVMKDGKIIYSEGMGLASKDLDVPVTRDTKFRIGQISELFTSFIYLRMVEDGTLDPDSTVQHYFPGFPEKRYTITLRDLANQTSGIRDELNGEPDWRGLNISLLKGIDKFKNDTLLYPPGLFQTDCMFHYNLLGAVMEKATKKHFGEILKDYVTDTLKLTNTMIDNPFSTIKGRTNYFDNTFVAQVINATFRDMRYRAPSQGLLSNAEDLVKFGNAVVNSNLLSEKTKKEMFVPAILYDNVKARSANGWILLADRDNKVVYGRRGAVTGGNSSILVYPEYGLVVAYTTNLNSSIDDSLVFDIASHFIPKREEKTEKKN